MKPTYTDVMPKEGSFTAIIKTKGGVRAESLRWSGKEMQRKFCLRWVGENVDYYTNLGAIFITGIEE